MMSMSMLTATTEEIKAALEAIHAAYEAECGDIREGVVEEGYPSNGSTYAVRVEALWQDCYAEEAAQLEDLLEISQMDLEQVKAEIAAEYAAWRQECEDYAASVAERPAWDAPEESYEEYCDWLLREYHADRVTMLGYRMLVLLGR